MAMPAVVVAPAMQYMHIWDKNMISLYVSYDDICCSLLNKQCLRVNHSSYSDWCVDIVSCRPSMSDQDLIVILLPSTAAVLILLIVMLAVLHQCIKKAILRR